MACYLDIVPVQGVIEIGGIWFSPDMQRTRAATETLFLMMSYAMDELCYLQPARMAAVAPSGRIFSRSPGANDPQLPQSSARST
jgi:hypothetical protein